MTADNGKEMTQVHGKATKSGQYVSNSSTQHESRNKSSAAQARTKGPYAELQDQHAEEMRVGVKRVIWGYWSSQAPDATLPDSTRYSPFG